MHGNIYGTSLAAVDTVKAAGKVCVLDIDVQGATSVKAAKVDAAFVFISPPSMAELERRLRGRGTETEEKVCCAAFAACRARCRAVPCSAPLGGLRV